MAEIRLLLDADVSLLLAETLRPRGHDVVHASEIGLRIASDDVVLAAAAAQGRAVLTHNVEDYVRLAHEYGRDARRHAGIVFARQQPFRELLRRAVTLLHDHRAEDVEGASIWLPR
jgi:predicted nuclease of predicted toxin-antitoxin system